MKLMNWLKSRLFRTQKSRRMKSFDRKPRLLERLEDRSLLATVVVDDNLACPDAAHSTIQAGINAANPGDTVQVCAGTYTENLTINNKALSLIGTAGATTLRPAASVPQALIGLSGTSFGADETVRIENFNLVGVNGPASAFYGIRVPANAQFNKLEVTGSDFQSFGHHGVSVDGDTLVPTHGGISVENVVLDNLTFSNNGTAGQQGSGDVSMFLYNGDASLTNVTLVGSATATTGPRFGIQLRGIGDQGVGGPVQAMGAVNLDNVDTSGTYRTQFIGLQRYSDVSTISFNDVALGGAGSAVTGTFGAALRIDAVGTVPNASVDLGNTYFRGLADYVPAFDIEFAPDNTYAFLRADATDTRWNTTAGAGVDLEGEEMSLAQLFEVEDRILHYVEPDHPVHLKPFKGFAEVVDGNAYITPTFGSIIQRGVEMVDVGGTVNVAAGTYNQLVTLDKSVTLDGAGNGSNPAVDTILTVPAIFSTSSSILTVAANDVTVKDLRVSGGPRGIQVTGTRMNLEILNSTLASNGVGFRMGTADNLDGLAITSSTVEGNTQGIFVAATNAVGGSYLTNVQITDTDFVNNTQKGAYFEKLNNAVFDGITVLNSGTDPAYAFNNGIDINLKFGAYSNITIQNSEFSGSGINTINGPGGLDFAAALAIKARNDAPSYNSVPATLTDVHVTGNVFKDGPEAMTTAIRIGEPGKNNTGPTGVEICLNDLTDGTFVGVDNTSTVEVDAEFNWWGTTNGAVIGSMLALGNVDFTPWLFDSAFSGNNHVFTDGDASLVVNQATGQYMFDDGEGGTYSGTGGSVQNGKIKIHDQSNNGKFDAKGDADGPVTVSLKGKGKPRTFTLLAGCE